MGCILVVDDQEENRHMLSQRLGRNGFDVLEAESGTAALECLHCQPDDIDLVLLDIRMPGMDGIETLEKIRTNFLPTKLPVIMVTAETDSRSVIRSMGLGADDYVTKPLDFPVLLARMRSKLALSKMVKAQVAGTVKDRLTVPDAKAIKELISAGENHEVEFKSTLRWNVHSKKNGKEVEIAWLKTVVAFLNTDGGTLLVGVADDGEILGNSLDSFSSDDKYLLHVNTCIKEHIGMAYTSHIFFDLVPVEDKKVLCIRCRAFKDAVFLRNGNDDEFYVRFGPGSRKLRAKEVLDYLKNR